MSEVDKVLNLNTSKRKIRTSFHLSQDIYERFKLLCVANGLIPSRVLDAAMMDIVKKLEKANAET